MALEQQPAGVGEVPTFERSCEIAHALILGLHVTNATRHARLELLAPLRIAGRLMAVLDAGVDDDERRLGRNGDEPVLERAAVEQDRVTLATQERRSLVEDAARHADRPQLGALTRKRELERLELEIRDRAEAGPAPERCRDERPAPTGRSEVTAPREGTGGAAVAATAQRSAPNRRRPRAPVGGERRRGTETLRDERHLTALGRDVDRDPVLDRDREHEAAAVVGVLTDQVHAAGRPRGAHLWSRRAGQNFPNCS
jgi:hypothetical protein